MTTRKTDHQILTEAIGKFLHPDGSKVGPLGRAILQGEKNLQDQGFHITYGGEERGFSHRPCEMCGGLAGDRHTLGLLKPKKGGMEHHGDIEACPDCVNYVANGELPIDDEE